MEWFSSSHFYRHWLNLNSTNTLEHTHTNTHPLSHIESWSEKRRATFPVPFFDLIFHFRCKWWQSWKSLKGVGKVERKPVLDYLYVVLISREISIQSKHQSKHRERTATPPIHPHIPDLVHFRFQSCSRSSELARIVLAPRKYEKGISLKNKTENLSFSEWHYHKAYINTSKVIITWQLLRIFLIFSLHVERRSCSLGI